MRQTNKKFFFGFVAGLGMMTVLSNASVTLKKFAAGTPISAAEVNANFQGIEGRMNGFIGNLGANFTLSCSNTGYSSNVNDYTLLPIVPSRPVPESLFNAAGEYVVPETGYYHILAELKASTMMYNQVQVARYTSAGTFIESYEESMTDLDTYRKLNASDRLRLYVYCHTNTSTTYLANSSFFMIKPL